MWCSGGSCGTVFGYQEGIQAWNTTLSPLVHPTVCNSAIDLEEPRMYPGSDGSMYYYAGGSDEPRRLEKIRVRDVVMESPLTNVPAFPHVVLLGNKDATFHQIHFFKGLGVHTVQGISTNLTRKVELHYKRTAKKKKRVNMDDEEEEETEDEEDEEDEDEDENKNKDEEQAVEEVEVFDEGESY